MLELKPKAGFCTDVENMGGEERGGEERGGRRGGGGEGGEERGGRGGQLFKI